MYILNIERAIKKCQLMKSETLSLKTVINELDFLKKTVVIIQWNVWKKIFIAASKQINKKILDLGNAKEHHQLFIRKKDTKSVKQ